MLELRWENIFIDTHAHLQSRRFDKDRDLVIKRAKKEKVTNIVNVGFDIDNCYKAIELAQNYKGLYASIGIHPHNSNQLTAETLKIFKKLLKNPKVVAIGEIGLDYYRNLSPQETQKQAFETQLSLAVDQNLPVIIHNRKADDDILKIISKFKKNIKGIMHCFSSDIPFSKKSIDLGFLISFAGNLTYPKANNLHETAKSVDLKSMLIETDSPWLTPQSMRGKRNESSYLPYIAQKIGDLKHTTVKEVAQLTSENAKKIFNIP